MEWDSWHSSCLCSVAFWRWLCGWKFVMKWRGRRWGGLNLQEAMCCCPENTFSRSGDAARAGCSFSWLKEKNFYHSRSETKTAPLWIKISFWRLRLEKFSFMWERVAELHIRMRWLVFGVMWFSLCFSRLCRWESLGYSGFWYFLILQSHLYKVKLCYEICELIRNKGRGDNKNEPFAL